MPNLGTKLQRRLLPETLDDYFDSLTAGHSLRRLFEASTTAWRAQAAR